MPVVTFHLTAGQNTIAQQQRLLVAAADFFAKTLACPVDRVRAFVNLYQADLQVIGGRLVSESGDRAPYFSFIVLEGRPLETRQQLLAGFTDLIVEILGVERALVRGGVIPVAPEDWAIGGTPAALKRATEIEDRAKKV
jgi:4-oxalocrotonate tautomerase